MHWQRFMAVLLAVGLLFNFTGCKDEPELSPELTINPPVVEATAEGGTLSVSYTIKNPAEGAMLTAKCEASWIADIHHSDTEIIFTVLPNDKEESRNTVVSVDYAGISPAPSFTVNQASASDEPNEPDFTKDMFSVEVTDITQMTANVIIIPEDPEITYFGFQKLFENFDENLTDDEIFENDIAWLKTWADAYGVSLKTLLKKNLITGDTTIPLSGMTSNTKYAYWVYGINANTLKRTTKITKTIFKTLEPVYSHAQINISKEVKDDQLIVTYDPGDFTGYYYSDIYPTCNPEFDKAVEQREMEELYLGILAGLKDKLPNDEILKKIGNSGITKDTIDVETDQCYLITALTFDETNFSVTSEVFLDSYYHGVYEKFILDFQPKLITGKSAKISVIPNKPEQVYAIALYETDKIKDLDDNKILHDICLIPEKDQHLYVGEQELKFDKLKKSTDYTICGAAFNEQYGWVASALTRKTFTTTDGNSENEPFYLDIQISNITQTGAKVSFVPSKENSEYTCMVYPQSEFDEMTEEEVIADMIASGNLDIHTGKYTMTLDQLEAGKHYVACAIGYDSASQQANSDLNNEDFKTKSPDFTLKIETSEITANSAKAVFTPNDIEADYTAMLLTAEEVAGMSEQEITEILLIIDNINTHHDVYTKTYDGLQPETEYAIYSVKFNWDTCGADSELFKSEFKTKKAEEGKEFNIAIDVTDITENGATINYNPSDENHEYTIMFYAYEDIQNATDEEIIADMFLTDNMWLKKGAASWSLNDLQPETTYIACAAGMDSNTFTCNSGLFKKEFITTGGNGGGDVSDFNVAIDVTDITESGATINFTGSDENHEYTIMYYAYEDVQNASEEEIIDDMFKTENMWPKKGAASWTVSNLMPETTYVACAAGMNSNTFTCDSGLFMKEFTTTGGNGGGDAEALDIMISLSDVTANSVKAKFIPSDVNKDYSVMIYSMDEFEPMTMDELVSDMISSENLNTHHDTYIKTFDNLAPNTSYVVCAVGFNWDTFSATTEAFTMSMITEGSDVPANFIEIKYGPYYDAMAVAAAEPGYADMAADGQVLMGFEVTSGSESEIVKWYITDAASINGFSDDDVAAFFRFSGYTDTKFVKAFDYGASVCIMGIAYDKNGNPSQVFRGQEVVPTKDGVGDPAEFVANFPR